MSELTGLLGSELDFDHSRLELIISFLPKYFLALKSGEGGYTVQPCPGLSVGTQIELKLRSDCRQYSDVDEVKRVANKYSSFTGLFVPFDVTITLFSLSTYA